MGEVDSSLALRLREISYSDIHQVVCSCLSLTSLERSQLILCYIFSSFNPFFQIILRYTLYLTDMVAFYVILSGYIGEFEQVDDHRAGKIVVQLNGRLNKTGVISPRFNVQVTQIESWVNLLLPSRNIGIIILVRIASLSTNLSLRLQSH